MATVVRTVGPWALSLGLLGGACASDGDDGDDGMDTQVMDASTGAPGGDGAPMTSGTSAAETSDRATDSTGDDSMSPGSTDDGPMGDESSGGGSSGGEQAFDEEFMWVADFMLDNCIACHATNANGALVLPSLELTYEEVRVALDGVVANTGLLLVEPGDRNMSQTWLQITNEFGAQFPVEQTDRFGDWIDAGANYYAQ